MIIRATEKLVIQKDILEHENRNLRNALIDKKKRRKKGKAMELFAKNEPGQAMFFSPGKIAAVRARQQELEAQKEQEKLAKEVEKERKAAEKKLKAQEVRERKIARQQLATQKKEVKHRENEARIFQKQADKQLIHEQLISKTPVTINDRPKKRKLIEDLSELPPPPKSRIGRGGRNINLPTRFLD